MNSRISRVSPDPFSSTRDHLESWRRHRSPGTRIPECLWVAAVDLARDQGVSKTSSALRLGYYALKERLEAAPSSRRKPRVVAEDPGGSFVEMPFSVEGSSPEGIVEVEDGRGTRMRVELRGPAVSEIEALARSLWSGAKGRRSR
jgi:hypothetical protein